MYCFNCGEYLNNEICDNCQEDLSSKSGRINEDNDAILSTLDQVQIDRKKVQILLILCLVLSLPAIFFAIMNLPSPYLYIPRAVIFVIAFINLDYAFKAKSEVMAVFCSLLMAIFNPFILVTFIDPGNWIYIDFFAVSVFAFAAFSRPYISKIKPNPKARRLQGEKYKGLIFTPPYKNQTSQKLNNSK